MSVAPVVIVGGGTSGSIVARTLASACAAPVVVVEPGPLTDDDRPRFMDGLADDVLWPGDPVPQARALGGGSAVNGMILSGQAPEWLEGLVRTARPGEAGSVGSALLGAGGRLATMWWNGGRWNPARALLHVVEEGRAVVRRSTVSRLRIVSGRAAAVVTDGGEIPCSHVVMCAGALRTPQILLASGAGDRVGLGLQNHPTVSFTVGRPGPDRGFFDACVVRDLSAGGGTGLMVAFERVSAAEDDAGLVTVSLMNPRSRGSVGGSVDFGLLSDPEDAARMDMLVARARGVLGEAGLRILAESGVHGVSHPSSSCSSSVDGNGRLLGHPNITVADASVLPSVPDVTPAASVTIEARRIALSLAKELA